MATNIKCEFILVAILLYFRDKGKPGGFLPLPPGWREHLISEVH